MRRIYLPDRGARGLRTGLLPSTKNFGALRFENYLIGTPQHAAHLARVGSVASRHHHHHPTPIPTPPPPPSPPPPPPPPAPLPTPPVASGNLAQVCVNGATVASLFPMDGNDSVGDCTCACAAHSATIWSAKAKAPVVDASADVVDTYFSLTGGSDTGLAQNTVLNAWMRGPLFGVPAIQGYLTVDPNDLTHVQLAINMFGGLQVGFVVRQDTLTAFENGGVWDAGPFTQDGHEVVIVDYDMTNTAAPFECLSWGGSIRATMGWLTQAGALDNLNVVLPAASILDVAGWDASFDWQLLNADFGLLAN